MQSNTKKYVDRKQMIERFKFQLRKSSINTHYKIWNIRIAFIERQVILI